MKMSAAGWQPEQQGAEVANGLLLPPANTAAYHDNGVDSCSDQAADGSHGDSALDVGPDHKGWPCSSSNTSRGGLAGWRQQRRHRRQ
jgi:hypothetical protein